MMYWWRVVGLAENKATQSSLSGARAELGNTIFRENMLWKEQPDGVYGVLTHNTMQVAYIFGMGKD